MILGLAGKTGSGKNAAAAVLERRGFRTLDLDAVAHRALAAMADRIERALGPGLLDGSGAVDRRRLGRIVFADPAKLAILEGLTYPWIERETRRWLEDSPGTPAAIHAINLHKTGLVELCDAVLWIEAPARVRMRRLAARDGLSRRELRARMRSQEGLGPKLFSRRAETYSVGNSGDPRRLERRLAAVLEELGYGREL